MLIKWNSPTCSSQLLSTWLLLSRYTTTRGSTMTKRLCLLGISLWIDECTQCGASSGSSETLGESMAMKLAHARSFGCFRSRVSVFSSCPYKTAFLIFGHLVLVDYLQNHACYKHTQYIKMITVLY